MLTVYPIEPKSPEAGQWVFTGLPCDDATSRALWAVGSSVGLVPVFFHKRYRELLVSPTPICLVADTNALFNGTALQAVKLRGRYSTQFVVPDQVFMEVQRQREARPPTGADGAQPELRLQDAVRRARTSRALRRIANLPLPVHHVRPPEAMVRYFGGTGVEGDGVQGVGPNYHRDRLIIEALRQQRAALPNMPVYLLTSDARMAVQAELEGFEVIFSEMPQARGVPLVLTSPWIEPYRFVDDHIEVTDFVEELVWNLRKVALQAHGKATGTVWSLPGDELDVARLELGVAAPREPETRSMGRKTWPGTPPAALDEAAHEDAQHIVAPAKAPGAGSLLETVVRVAEAERAGVPLEQVFEPVLPYIKALGWADEREGRLFCTPEGYALGREWAPAANGDPQAWLVWMRQGADKIMKVSSVVAARRWLSDKGRENDESLGKGIGISKSNAGALARLMSSFGLCVRTRGFIFPTRTAEGEQAATWIHEAIRTRQASAQDPGAAVRVEAVFLDVLKAHGVSLIDFRDGLLRLHGQGLIKLSGSAPASTGGDPLAVDAVVPRDGLPAFTQVHLGAGDFLVPGESSQVVRLANETTT